MLFAEKKIWVHPVFVTQNLNLKRETQELSPLLSPHNGFW